MTFNKENMIKWAEALESGKYKQVRDIWGQSTINPGEVDDEGGFCCLNVALMEFTGKDYGHHLDDDGLQTFRVYLNPNWCPNEHSHNFIEMNDDLGLTFQEIAQEIRKMVA